MGQISMEKPELPGSVLSGNQQSGLRNILPVKYDPDAKAPLFRGAMLKIFSEAENPKELVRFFNELIGYSIQPDRSQPIIVVCMGRGSNGKTSLVELIVKLIGSDLVRSGRVDELEKDRFALGGLFGKLLFIDDDVRAGAKLPDGTLKKISEAKVLTGEHKFKDQFNFVNRAFPMLLCNNAPSLADLSHGMMRRLIVVPFQKQFSKEEQDRTLFPRIVATELSGVLNHALRAWSRLQKRGHFADTPDLIKARDALLRTANPLQSFIEERCAKRKSVTFLRFYEAYKEWAHESGYTLTQNKNTVKGNLENLGYRVVRRGAGQTVDGLDLK